MGAIKGSGATSLWIAQRSKATELWGADEGARFIPPIRYSTIPFTPAAYAIECLKGWHSMLSAVMSTLVDNETAGGDPFHLLTPSGDECLEGAREAAAGLKAGRLPDIESAARRLAKCSVTAAEGLRGLYDAYVAIKVGAFSSSVQKDGVKVLDPVSCRIYWDASEDVARTVAASSVSVTADERWATFTNSAKESLNKISETAGSAAGAVVGAAGSALGVGIGSFFDELGLVKMVILGAGGYVAWRVL